MHTDKSYFVLGEREFSLNEAGLCVCCHRSNVEPIVDYEFDYDPETGTQTSSLVHCGFEYVCEACAEIIAEADIVIWDKPEAPPVVLPFHMTVMVMASTEYNKINDELPF